MSEPKSFASLGPMLLARKGTAKPAMRVQLGTADRTAMLDDAFDDLANSQSALGWNDMGDAESSGVYELHIANDRGPDQQRRNARRQRNAGAHAGAGHRAAFTLRLDTERHLKLRLAATMHGRSAQELVTEALDRYLAEVPELNDIAARVSRQTGKA